MLKDAFVDGLWRRNAATVQLLGLCPLLAVSYNLQNAFGLAIASTFVLVGSSLAISAIRSLIPKNVRLPCFVLVIATLTTVSSMYMEAFAFDIYSEVALFVQIIVTNCMILGHVESTAYRKTLGVSVTNAVATAIGFSAALIALGAIRQGLAPILPLVEQPAGAFLITGIAFAGLNWCSNTISGLYSKNK